MAAYAAAPSLGHEFDRFLFASLGDDKNDMPISVMSALARLDVDAWQEAAKLARLPVEAAIERLTWLIEGLPDGTATSPDPKTLAAHLIALLPRQASATVTPRFVGKTSVARMPTSRALVIAAALVALSATLWFSAGTIAVPEPGGPSRSPATDAILSK